MAPLASLFPLELPDGAAHLKSALSKEQQNRLLAAIREVAKSAEFSHPRTKSGGIYSAEITNCGIVGWWSDESGRRYSRKDPRSGKPWPKMPVRFTEMLRDQLLGTEIQGFEPDVCLINHYATGAKMGLHQDKDEADLSHPIVTISLGAAADFLIGGFTRSDKPDVLLVESGDIVILAGESRMRFHGIRKVHHGTSPLPDLDGRLSLTFRKAL